MDIAMIKLKRFFIFLIYMVSPPLHANAGSDEFGMDYSSARIKIAEFSSLNTLPSRFLVTALKADIDSGAILSYWSCCYNSESGILVLRE